MPKDTYMTLELGASKNLLTVHEGGKVTEFDRSTMTLDERIKLTKAVIPAWAAMRGIKMKQPYRGRKGRSHAKAS